MRKMTEIFVYILGASHITYGIECYVPEELDERTIFFGPCKRDLRKVLRARFLNGKDSEDISKSEIYLVGLNASNREKDRRIVWVGKITGIMTFERAWSFFKTKGKIPETLHLRPLYRKGQLIGYKHVGGLHKENNEWIWDIVNKRRKRIRNLYFVEDSELILKNVRDRQEVFERDCCFICDNIFFAGNNVTGMKITKKIVDIFKEAQPNKEIDDYYIFGPKCPPGFTLHRKGEIADRLIEELLS